MPVDEELGLWVVLLVSAWEDVGLCVSVGVIVAVGVIEDDAVSVLLGVCVTDALDVGLGVSEPLGD